MKRNLPSGLGLILVLGFPLSAQAGVIANSITEHSGSQGQDGWAYGYFVQGVPGVSYTPGAFVPFDLFDAPNQRWAATPALVGGPLNSQFLQLNPVGGHPTGLGPSGQDRIIWAVRRYQSEVDGIVDIAFDVHKINVENDRGGGITAHIFVDGVEVFQHSIGNLDALGVQGVLTLPVQVGTLIDFAIDPAGHTPLVGSDGLYSARADGSHFSALVFFPSQVVPEPSGLALLGTGLLVMAASLRRSGRGIRRL